MSKAVDIIVDQFVNKAVKQGLIMPTRSHPTPDAWKQELQKSYETYSGSQARKAAQGWYNSLVAAQTKNRYGRQMDLVEMTSPNMIGFFPVYDPNARHSNFAITMFDTETADKNTDIIEAAGFKLIYNKDAKRFERLPNASVSNSQFYGVYNPKDASYVQTEQVHGRNAHTLVSLDGKIPTGWGTEQLNQFLAFSKGTILSGHNIMNADLSWIHGRPTEGFKFIEPTFQQGILDTLHLSAALLGKGKPGEGRNALQTLAQKFNVNAELPGLPVHAGWADTIKNVKVLEHLLAIDHPATREFLEAMDTGNRHSHYMENPDPLHNSGFVTHGISQKAAPLGVVGQALKKVSVKVREKILKDIPAALGISSEDYYNGNWDKSSYEEMSMAQDDEEMKEYLQKTYGHLGAGGGPQWSLHMEEMLRDIAGNYHLARTSAKAKVVNLIKGLSETDAKYAISELGFRGSETALLRLKSFAEQKDLAKEDALNYRNLNRRVGAFLNKSAAQGWRDELWFQDLRQQHKDKTLTELDFARAQEAKQHAEKQADTWSDFMSWAKAEGSAASRSYTAEQQKRAEKQADTWSDFMSWAKAEGSAASRSYTAEQQRRAEKQAAHDAKLGAIQERLGLQSTLDTWNELERRKQKKNAFEDKLRSQKWDSQRFWAEQDVRQRAEMRDARQDAQKAYRQGYLFHGDIGALEEKAAVGTKAYREELDKLIDRNQKILGVTKQLAKAFPFVNPMSLFNDISRQAHGIQYAAHGILPMFAERPIFRFGHALGNLWGQFRSNVETNWGYASMMARGLGAIGGGIVGSAFPGVGTAIGAAGGSALAGALSEGVNLFARNKINQYGEGIQHRLNLLGMATSVLGAFINGLKLCIGLFGKLGRIWSYMPDYTMSTLTGVAWSKASGMSVADNLLGFKSGTVSNQYTKLAYQQADLYTSGRYDEKALVAAARLGIFDLAYAPTGGDIEQQQADIYDRLYKSIYESGLSKAERQSQLALIKDYSPEMASMLERGHGMVDAGYKQYRNYKAFQSMFGYNTLSDNENARVSYTASRWGAAQLSMTQGLSLAGSRAYDILDSLIIKPINKVLWDFARTGTIDWKAITDMLNGIFDKLGEVDLSGVDWDKILKLFDPLGEKIKEKLQGIFGPLGEFITQLSLTKIEFHPEKLTDVLFHGASIGELLSLVTPEKLAAEKVANSASAGSIAEEQAKSAYYSNANFNEVVAAAKNPVTLNAKFGRASLQRAKYYDMLAEAANGDTNKFTNYRTFLDTFLGSNADLLESHKIANWDKEGISKLITKKSYKGLIDAGMPEQVAQKLLEQSVLQSYAAAHGVENISALGGETVLQILSEIREIFKSKEFTVNVNNGDGNMSKTVKSQK